MRYIKNHRPIRSIDENLYQIYAEYPIDKVKDAQGLKEWLGCETTFKSNQNGTYIFCSKIEEAQIVE
jgi:hypothetical protein